jgi:hypothetical protein
VELAAEVYDRPSADDIGQALSAERGGNRTFNLLLKRQQPVFSGFSDFRTFQVGNLRQKWSRLVPRMVPTAPPIYLACFLSRLESLRRICVHFSYLLA